MVEQDDGSLIPLDITKHDAGNGKYTFTGEAVIESLEEYFEHLKDLVYGNDELPEEAALLFLKLPLDEPHFKINANTRKIEIPKHFMDNGLSVQGDEVAEIVFFEIDRYYDATDLYETNIAIEWEIGSGNTKVAGYTPAFIKTTHDFVTPDDKDKVIFGWPITSEITAQAGKMTFSVRFYNEYANNNIYDYSFRTLPATININQGLAVDPLKVDADDASELILRRIVNSRKDGTYGEATIPYIMYTNYPTGTEFLAITENTVLGVLAHGGTRSGTLSYAWYRDGKYLEPGENPWQTLNEKNTYIPTKEFITDAYGVSVNSYYKLVDGEYELVVILTPSDFASELSLAPNETLYIKVAYYTLTPENAVAGTYTVDVQNKFYTTEKYASENTDVAKKSPVWILLGPDEISVITDLPDTIALGSILFVELEGASVNTTYQWYYSKSGNDDDFIGIEGAESNTLIPDEEGYYYLRAVNTRNAVTSADNSNKCLVVGPIDNDFVKKTVLNVANGFVEAQCIGDRDLANPYSYESYECTWAYFDAEVNKIDEETNHLLSLNIDTIKTTYPDVKQVSFKYKVSKLGIDESVSSDLAMATI